MSTTALSKTPIRDAIQEKYPSTFTELEKRGFGKEFRLGDVHKIDGISYYSLQSGLQTRAFSNEREFVNITGVARGYSYLLAMNSSNGNLQPLSLEYTGYSPADISIESVKWI